MNTIFMNSVNSKSSDSSKQKIMIERRVMNMSHYQILVSAIYKKA